MRSYLKTDFLRLITSWQFYGGILGIGLLYFFAGYQSRYFTDVYMSYFYNSFFSTAILAYAFCAMSFSGCFLEDRARSYWLLEIQRGNCRRYVWAKLFTCFLSGMLGGIFSMLSAYLSLYERHRIFTICAPVIGFYFVDNFLISTLKLPEFCSIWYLYGAGYSVFGNSARNLLFGIAVAVLVLLLLEHAAYKKIREEACGIYAKTNAHK